MCRHRGDAERQAVIAHKPQLGARRPVILKHNAACIALRALIHAQTYIPAPWRDIIMAEQGVNPISK